MQCFFENIRKDLSFFKDTELKKRGQSGSQKKCKYVTLNQNSLLPVAET